MLVSKQFSRLLAKALDVTALGRIVLRDKKKGAPSFSAPFAIWSDRTRYGFVATTFSVITASGFGSGGFAAGGFGFTFQNDGWYFGQSPRIA